jgi:hypothetical protein
MRGDRTLALEHAAARPGEAIQITGAERGVLSFAACCHPIPGDEIMGYLSAGKGIVGAPARLPQRARVPQVAAALRRDRLGPRGQRRVQGRAARGGGQSAGRAGRRSRPAIAESGSNIENVEYRERDASAATLLFTIEVRDRVHLAQVMRPRAPRARGAHRAQGRRLSEVTIGAGMAREIISTKDAPAAIGTYSQAVRCGNTVYLSGQIPLDPGDRRPGRKARSRRTSAACSTTCARSAAPPAATSTGSPSSTCSSPTSATSPR